MYSKISYQRKRLLFVLTVGFCWLGCRPSPPAAQPTLSATSLHKPSHQTNGLPFPEDVFTVASSPLTGKEFVPQYNTTTLTELLPRLKLLSQYTSGNPPNIGKDYRYQEGVLVLKDKSVFYWNAFFEGKAYLKNRVVGYIEFIPPNINETRFYALP